MSVSLLEGTPNFRDLGGLATVDNRVTRRGVLFRSSGLEELQPGDVRYLIDDIGLRTVIDLRSVDDCEIAESLVDTSIRYVNLPIVREGSFTSLERPMRTDGRVDMARLYGMYLEKSGPSISRITCQGPVIWHLP